MSLESRYADGQFAALAQLKLAFPAATHPVVQQSATLQSQAPKPMSSQAQERLAPPTTPFNVSQLFSVHEQAHTRTEPMRKLSAERMCTSCRREKHYGSCARPIPIKRADFNAGMHGNDPSTGNNPSMSPHYHSATTADSALGRSRDGRPADEQAGTYFADLFRANGGGLNGMADEPGRMTGGLNKVAGLPSAFHSSTMDEGLAYSENALIKALSRRNRAGQRGAAVIASQPHPLTPTIDQGLSKLRARGLQMKNLARSFQGTGRGLTDAIQRGKLGDWQLWGTYGHSTHEGRGPTPNPYEEHLTRKSPPVGFGDEGSQRIRRAFDQVDNVADSTNIGGGFGTPSGGPAVLG